VAEMELLHRELPKGYPSQCLALLLASRVFRCFAKDDERPELCRNSSVLVTGTLNSFHLGLIKRSIAVDYF
jgi:hypothetical protein